MLVDLIAPILTDGVGSILAEKSRQGRRRYKINRENSLGLLAGDDARLAGRPTMSACLGGLA